MLAQCHLAADGLVFAQLEARDCLLGLGNHRLLAGDQAKLCRSSLHNFAIVDVFAHAHVDDDLIELRHLHGVLVVELLLQIAANLFFIHGLQARNVCAFRFLCR